MELTIGNLSFPVKVDEKALCNFLLTNLLKIPDTSMVFLTDKQGTPYLAGNPMSVTDIIYWKEHIAEFVKSPVWHLLSHTVVEIARKHMFENSKTAEDMVFGKSMLYVADLQQNILKVIGGIQVPQQSKAKK
jgi:hypothetical protein